LILSAFARVGIATATIEAPTRDESSTLGRDELTKSERIGAGELVF
jgi:hypothetical protein